MHLGHKIGRQCDGKRQLVLMLACGLVLSNTAVAEERQKRQYTLAEENNQHAKDDLPRHMATQDAELTRQVHNLYVDCLSDKFWEPALPGRPYR